MTDRDKPETSWWAEGVVSLYLFDYTAPPKVGGGQHEGDAAAATASCLPHVKGGGDFFFLVFSPETMSLCRESSVTRELSGRTGSPGLLVAV